MRDAPRRLGRAGRKSPRGRRARTAGACVRAESQCLLRAAIMRDAESCTGWILPIGSPAGKPRDIQKRKRPTSFEIGRLVGKALAMTYFLTGNPQYHRRDVVSRPCSGWEGVGPTRYGRQELGCACSFA